MVRKLCADKSRNERRKNWTRPVAFALAVLMTTFSIPVYADDETDDGVTPTYDEAYYATLDYYGNLKDGSVVKSYALNGAMSLTDYGTYDDVVNLTDGTAPVTAGAKTTFTFDKDTAPSHFYFEGKTTQPFKALPWSISLSYTLNGVPTKAENLAGKTGVVEITAKATPNKNASSYAQNNYTLEAIAMFNADDILSLEAPGAQVQLVGNLRTVLFLALPGEDQTFTMRVGSDDFSFDGMTFMMVPATLSQLDQIADLQEKKADIEDNYDKLSDSLDTLLDSLNSMDSSLYATADGLDELNEARGTISDGKDEVYDKADKVLSDLGDLDDSMSAVPDDIDSASQAVTDVTDSLTDVTATAVSLKSNLKSLTYCIEDLQDDMDDIKDELIDNVQPDLSKLGTDINKLKVSLSKTNSTLNDFDLTVGGETLSVSEASKTADALNESFAAADADGSEALDFGEFMAAGLVMSGVSSDTAALMAEAYVTGDTESPYYAAAAAQAPLFADFFMAITGVDDISDGDMSFKMFMSAALLLQAYSEAYAESYQEQIEAYEAAYGEEPSDETLEEIQEQVSAAVLESVLTDENISQAKSTASSLNSLYSGTTSGLYDNLSALSTALGSSGITGDLSSLNGMAVDVLDDMDYLGDIASDIIEKTNTLLDEMQELDDTINDYVPDLQDALTDVKDLANNMTTTVTDTSDFLSTFESLLKEAGPQLDAGTQKTLSNLATSLRQAAGSLTSTGDVREAKDTINDIVEDLWDDYTGDVDNLLNMDSTAEAVSLTSVNNPAPQSIQVLIRSEEIKEEDETVETQTTGTADNGTFWSRVSQMFQDFWHTITGLFD